MSNPLFKPIFGLHSGGKKLGRFTMFGVFESIANAVYFFIWMVSPPDGTQRLLEFYVFLWITDFYQEFFNSVAVVALQA
jgi:hypothetical protein